MLHKHSPEVDSANEPLVPHAPPNPTARPAEVLMNVRVPEAFREWCVRKAAHWSLNGNHYEPQDALRWVLEYGQWALQQREADEARYRTANSQHHNDEYTAQLPDHDFNTSMVFTDLPIADFRTVPNILADRMPRRQTKRPA